MLTAKEKLALIRAGGRIDTPPTKRQTEPQPQKIKTVTQKVRSKKSFLKKFSSKSIPKKTQNYFIKTYGGYQQPKVRRVQQPSQAQLMQRQKFLAMVRQNQKFQNQKKMGFNDFPRKTFERGTPSAPSNYGGGSAPQQFQRPQPVGVWAKNNNSSIGSKMPQNNRIWKRRPIYHLEGDLMGNIKLKEYGTEEAFFN